MKAEFIPSPGKYQKDLWDMRYEDSPIELPLPMDYKPKALAKNKKNLLKKDLSQAGNQLNLKCQRAGLIYALSFKLDQSHVPCLPFEILSQQRKKKRKQRKKKKRKRK